MGKFRKTEIVNIGGFDLKKFGSLRVFEEEWLENFYAKLRDAVTKPALELGEWIADNEGKTTEEAMEFVESLDSLKPSVQMAILSRYRKALPDLIDQLQSAPKRQKLVPRDIATWVLNSRLPDGWITENRNELRDDLGIDATGDEWLAEWTDELDESTVNELYSFVLKERNGWLSVAAEFAPTAEDGEPQTLGEGLTISVTGSPPTGDDDGQLSKQVESAIQSFTGKTGEIALAI